MTHNYTIADVRGPAGHRHIDAPAETLEHSPLPWMARGLSETASGYGGHLTTTYKIHYCGRLYRVYCMCYSNSGTCYITVKGETIYIDG
jgi:hypothetical protein